MKFRAPVFPHAVGPAPVLPDEGVPTFSKYSGTGARGGAGVGAAGATAAAADGNGAYSPGGTMTAVSTSAAILKYPIIAETVEDTVFELARRGDVRSAALWLNITKIPKKPELSKQEIPGLADAGDALEASRIIRRAVATGEISPTRARDLMSIERTALEIEDAYHQRDELQSLREMLEEAARVRSAGGGRLVQGEVIEKDDRPSLPAPIPVTDHLAVVKDGDSGMEVWVTREGTVVETEVPIWGPEAGRARARAMEWGLLSVKKAADSFEVNEEPT